MTEHMDVASGGLGPEDPKILLFSGHDTTVMPIVASLIGDKLDRWPPYVANVVRMLLRLILACKDMLIDDHSGHTVAAICFIQIQGGRTGQPRIIPSLT